MNPNSPQADPLTIVVMGVSGCGKSTIAEALARKIDAHFKDADELHPAGNIEKMESGTPLNDEDREPWLADVASYARKSSAQHGICVIACSALKASYREILRNAGRIVFVYLNGSFDLISGRMRQRSGHFMPETLLQSQFDALEDPTQESDTISVSIEKDPDSIALDAVNALKSQGYVTR